MKKIPVGATIAHAYRFAFGNFLTVLRAMWLPLAIQLGFTLLLLSRTTQFLSALQDKDPAALSLFGPVLLLYPVILVLFFMQILAVTETALGLRPATGWFYFPLGKKLWRLIGGFILAILAIAALITALFLVVILLGVLAHGRVAASVAAIVAGVTILVTYAIIIFVAVRFLFMLAPANILEQRAGVGRAWLLSRGNFWRALLVILSIVIPMGIVEYGAMFVLGGLPPFPHAGESAQAFQAARMAWNIAVFSSMASHWYLVLPVMAVLMVLYFGAGCSSQVFAYRALTDGEALASVTSD
jgi:hypothetical protein